MTTFPVEVRPSFYGIVLALYPSDLRAHIQIQRAPDSGGSPDTGSAEIIGVAAPGQRTFTDLRGSGTWHYRIRSIRPGATSSAWTDWVAATSKPIPAELPQLPDVGGWIIKQGRLESGDFVLDAPNEQMRLGSGVTGPLTGVGIFLGLDGSEYEFRAGNPAGDMIHWDGTDLTITGEITADAGSIGGWLITATTIEAASGNFTLDSDVQRLLVGAASAPLTGDGVFVGLSGGAYQFRAGDPAGDYLLWDGSALVLSGEIIGSGNIVDGAVLTDKINDAAVERAKLGNNSVDQSKLFVGSFDNLIFNPGGEQAATAAHWIAVNSGLSALTLDTSGTPRSGARALRVTPSATMNSFLSNAPSSTPSEIHDVGPAVTEGDRIYLEFWVRQGPDGATNDVRARIRWTSETGGFLGQSLGTIVTPTTTYQRVSVSGTAPAGAVLAILQARVENDGSANRIVFDDFYARRMVEGSLVVDGTLTAVHIESLSFSGKTATFDTGSIGGWLMSASTLHSAPSGNRITIDAANEAITIGAASAPLTGVGIFLGKDGSDYEFRVGNPAGEYIHWDGTAFEIKAESFTASNPVFDGIVTVEGGLGVQQHEFRSGTGSRGATYRLYDDAGVQAGEIWSFADDLLVRALQGQLILRANTTILVEDSLVALSDGGQDIGTAATRFGTIYGTVLDGDAVHIGSGVAGSPPSGTGRLYTANGGTQLWFINPSGTSTQIV
jgi:hypothetical protein